eukprot:12053601-Ditylum_brightwellii.AAC.1
MDRILQLMHHTICAQYNIHGYKDYWSIYNTQVQVINHRQVTMGLPDKHIRNNNYMPPTYNPSTKLYPETSATHPTTYCPFQTKSPTQLKPITQASTQMTAANKSSSLVNSACSQLHRKTRQEYRLRHDARRY